MQCTYSVINYRWDPELLALSAFGGDAFPKTLNYSVACLHLCQSSASGAGRTRTQVNTNSQPEKQNALKYVAEK